MYCMKVYYVDIKILYISDIYLRLINRLNKILQSYQNVYHIKVDQSYKEQEVLKTEMSWVKLLQIEYYFFSFLN